VYQNYYVVLYGQHLFPSTKLMWRHFRMEEVLNRYVTNPTPTLTPNHNRNSYPYQINLKIQKRNNFRNWSNDIMSFWWLETSENK
jgi:hypothetical protein